MHFIKLRIQLFPIHLQHLCQILHNYFTIFTRREALRALSLKSFLDRYSTTQRCKSKDEIRCFIASAGVKFSQSFICCCKVASKKEIVLDKVGKNSSRAYNATLIRGVGDSSWQILNCVQYMSLGR